MYVLKSDSKYVTSDYGDGPNCFGYSTDLQKAKCFATVTELINFAKEMIGKFNIDNNVEFCNYLTVLQVESSGIKVICAVV